MALGKKTGNVRAGEAGHLGHDRQPGGDGIRKAKGGTPDEGEAASAREVRERSEEARKMKEVKHERADVTHPGAGREAV